MESRLIPERHAHLRHESGGVTGAPHRTVERSDAHLALLVGGGGHRRSGHDAREAKECRAAVVDIFQTDITSGGIEIGISGGGFHLRLHRRRCGGVESELMNEVARTEIVLTVEGILYIDILHAELVERIPGIDLSGPLAV